MRFLEIVLFFSSRSLQPRRFITARTAAPSGSLRPLCIPFRFVSHEPIKFLYDDTHTRRQRYNKPGNRPLTKCLKIIDNRARAVMTVSAITAVSRKSTFVIREIFLYAFFQIYSILNVRTILSRFN